MIIRPFLYDFKKTITSKTVIILVAILLLISLTVIPLASIGGINTSSGFSPTNILYYHDGTSPNIGYHYLTYFTNQYGDGVSGATIIITFQGKVANRTSTVVTDSSGLAFLTVNAPNSSYTVMLTGKLSSSSFSMGLQDPATIRSPPGMIASLGGGSGQRLGDASIQAVIDKQNSSERRIQVFYAAAYGAFPSSYTLYYKVLPSFSGSSCTGTGSCPFNYTAMTSLGNLNNYITIFDPTIPTGLNETTAGVWFELFSQSKVEVGSAYFPISELRQPRQPVVSSSIASVFFSTIFGFFIPLMAIIGSYSSYGKDRLTGVLESVLARPVTKRSLAMSRFLSTVLSLTLASAAVVGVVDLLLNSIGGSFLDQSYALAIVAGLTVEIAAFTGLIFLLSHLLKSTGALLGISIGLFVVLDFFWSLIVFLLTLLLGGTSGSAVALEATFLSYYANPAQFLTLINVYVLQSSSSGLVLPPSSYGVTLPAIILDGILWAVVPFLSFLYLAIKRD